MTFHVIDPSSLEACHVKLAIPAKSCQRFVPEPDFGDFYMERSPEIISKLRPEWNVEPSRQATFANKMRLGRRVLVDTIEISPLWTKSQLRGFLTEAARDPRWTLAPDNLFRDRKNGSRFIGQARSTIRKEHEIAEGRLGFSLPAFDKLEDLEDSLVSLRTSLGNTVGWTFPDEYLQDVIAPGSPRKTLKKGERQFDQLSMDAALPFGLGRSGRTLVHSSDNIVVRLSLKYFAFSNKP